MDYRCEDILKMFARKWYFYLIAILLFCGGAFFLSKYSYSHVLKNYEELTYSDSEKNEKYDFSCIMTLDFIQEISEKRIGNILTDIKKVIEDTDAEMKVHIFNGSYRLLLTSEEQTKENTEKVLSDIVKNIGDLLNLDDILITNFENVKYSERGDRVASIILNQPVEKGLSLKNIIVAFVFAVIFTSCIIMIADYIKASRKLVRKSEEIN